MHQDEETKKVNISNEETDTIFTNHGPTKYIIWIEGHWNYQEHLQIIFGISLHQKIKDTIIIRLIQIIHY
jgi:hypothetical protein